jgi:hypothetical protein
MTNREGKEGKSIKREKDKWRQIKRETDRKEEFMREIACVYLRGGGEYSWDMQREWEKERGRERKLDCGYVERKAEKGNVASRERERERERERDL